MSSLRVLIKGFISILNEILLDKQNNKRWDNMFCGVIFGPILFAYVPKIWVRLSWASG